MSMIKSFGALGEDNILDKVTSWRPGDPPPDLTPEPPVPPAIAAFPSAAGRGVSNAILFAGIGVAAFFLYRFVINREGGY